MRPTPISSHFRPALGLGAGALPFLSTTARAADGPVFDGVTIVAAVCFVLTPFLIFATVYFRRRFLDANVRAADLEARLTREQALLDSAPQAIVCWDTGTGEQKISQAASRMIGCDQSDTLDGEQAVGDRQKSKHKAVE